MQITKKSLNLLLLFWFLPLLLIGSAGQNEVTVLLQINSDYEQFMGLSIDLENGEKLNLQYPFAKTVGLVPGETIVTFEDQPGNPSRFLVRVDSDGDGNLLEEPQQALDQEAPITVRVERRWSGGSRELQYKLSYDRTDMNGQVLESVFWLPHYRAEGTLRYQDCETLFTVLDFDGNGVFDEEEFERGTTVGIDRDGDGKIWGMDEWVSGNQIIEYCGDSFLISALSPDASFVKLVTTEARIPKVGEQAPQFTLTTMASETIHSRDLKGGTYLLDFWASWCSPCVAKFPKLQELDKKFDGRMQVIAVNVDDKEFAARAEKIIKQYRLTWPHVMNKMGVADPIWKLFGSMGVTRMSIPLYVLVDRFGFIQYAGHGGTDLKELVLKIESVLGE